ncbi:MAG: menaquinol-cytochrome c reductase cytochrome b subunit [Acidimicrobiia bacterium]
MAEIPEHLQRRAAEARAKAEGRPVGEAAAAPADASPVATASQNGGVGRDLDADAGSLGVPRPLLERSMFARAKADGTPVPQLVGAGAPAAAAGAAAPPPASAAPAAPAGPPPGVRTQRLLTVVKAGAIQGTTKEPTDKVNVWPHLLAIEFVALLAMLAFLTLLSAFVDAPLLEFANFNDQPNPSKAPWYFLGLQELLAYFDPMVAGVIIPGFGLAALAFIPYIDRNPSVRPSDRKLAISIFTVFFMAAAVLTIFGSFFRGPGFNFTFPWRDGIFFDDLLTILE